MAVDLVPNDWIDLRPTGGTDLAALQNVAAATMCCWTIPDDTGTDTLMGLSIGSSGATASSRLTIAKTGSAFQGGGRALDSDSNTLIPAGSYTPGTTYFVIMRVQFTTARGYLRVYPLGGTMAENDTTLGGMTAGNTSNTASRSASIGAEENGVGQEYDGKIWDARVYNRFLSDVECDILFAQCGQDDILEGLVHRFPLDEGAPGTAIGTGANLVKDVVSPVLTQQAAVGGPTWETPNNLLRRSA